MNVLLIYGTATLDVTTYLSDTDQISLNQELERNAFERAHGDIHLTLDNVDGTFTQVFSGERATKQWGIEVLSEGRKLFRGLIHNKSIKFGAKNLWMSCDCFHISKRFRDVASTTPVMVDRHDTEPGAVFTTLDYILRRELTQRYRDNNVFAEFFTTIDLGEFADQPIRFSSSRLYTSTNTTRFTRGSVTENGTHNYITKGIKAGMKVTAVHENLDTHELTVCEATITRIIDGELANPVLFTTDWLPRVPTNGTSFNVVVSQAIGNDGKFINLSRDTTTNDLLEAASIYYNAEFIIDIDTNSFLMKARNSILSDRANTESLDIDDVLCEDVEPEIYMLDDEKYDYVFLPIGLPFIPVPLFKRVVIDQVNGVRAVGLISYQMSAIINNREVRSDLITIERKPEEFLTPIVYTLTIPEVPFDGVVERRLYRTDFAYPGVDTLVLLARFTDNVQTEFSDTFLYGPTLNQRLYAQINDDQFGTWIKFNESTSTWDTPIVRVADDTQNPVGRIYKVNPNLSFRSTAESGSTKKADGIESFRFFGGQQLSPSYRARWKDWFRTKRSVSAKAEGLNFRIGDTIRSRKKLAINDLTTDDRMLIRAANNHLQSEETTLRMITI